MENIKHHYFGEISLSKADEFGVIWENEVERHKYQDLDR